MVSRSELQSLTPRADSSALAITVVSRTGILLFTAETDAFRNAGRQRSYRSLIMVTTLAPCWYCSGLVRQFGFGTLIVGESRTFQGGMEWLRSLGVRVFDLDSSVCASLLGEYIRKNPEVWNEDIGEE